MYDCDSSMLYQTLSNSYTKKKMYTDNHVALFGSFINSLRGEWRATDAVSTMITRLG